MDTPCVFESNGQRIKSYEKHAWLDYDFGPTMRWSDEKRTDVLAMDYRAGCQFCFCLGSYEPGSSIGVSESGCLTGDGRDIGQMIFGERPPKPHTEILEFYRTVRG